MSGKRYAIEDVTKMEKRIHTLESQVRELEGERDRLKELRSALEQQLEETQVKWADQASRDAATITRLRECLKRLEWQWNHSSEIGYSACPGCGHSRINGHAEDCWLKKELEGE